MPRTSRATLAASLLLAVAACGDASSTAIVIAISSDLAVPAELDSVEIIARRDGTERFRRTYALPTDATLPGTLTFERDADAGDGAVRYTVRGRNTVTGAVTVREARLGFVDGRTKLLRLRVQRACANVACDDGRTCIDGACAPLDLDPAQLPDFVSTQQALTPIAGAGGAPPNGGAAGAAGIAGGVGGAGTGGKSGAGQGGAAGAGQGGAAGAGQGGAAGAGQGGAAGAGQGGAAGAGQGGAAGAGQGGAAGAGQGGAAGAGAGQGGAAGAGQGGVAGAAGGAVVAAPSTLSVGWGTTCALSTTGDVWCWGASQRYLIYPASVDVPPPITASPMARSGVTGMTGVSVGGGHACARSPAGVVCWGTNDNGELGPNGASTMGDPALVTGVGAVVDVRALLHGGCAIDTAGAVRCWGWNADGQLGAPGPSSAAPVLVAVPPASALAEGDGANVMCVLAGGVPWCWGGGLNGPVQITDLANVTRVVVQGAGGWRVLLQTGDGKVFYTQPLASPAQGFEPVKALPVLDGATALGAGVDVCGALPNGSVQCAPYLGVVSPFKAVAGFAGATVTELRVGATANYGFSVQCARLATNELRCWGDDEEGQLGIGKPDARSVPTEVPGITGALDVTATYHATFLVNADGSGQAWGGVVSGGAPGPGDPLVTSPAMQAFITGAKQVAVSGYADELTYTLSKTDGSLSRFQYGVTVPGTAGLVGKGPGFLRVFSALDWDIGLKADGTLVSYARFPASATVRPAFGNGGVAVAGGQTTTTTLPSDIAGLALPQTYDPETACAWTVPATGKLFGWGKNTYGQLGALSDPVTSPTLLTTAGAANVLSACVGGDHLCYVTASGAVYCQGSNYFGQLGNLVDTGGPSPVLVTVPGSMTTVACGVNQTCAWGADGAAFCWGFDVLGSLGIGASTSGAKTPAPLVGVAVSQMSLGPRHACAVLQNGKVACWGRSGFGELGLGASGQVAAATPVLPFQ